LPVAHPVPIDTRQTSTDDHELAAVIAAWPTLSQAVRAEFVAMVTDRLPGGQIKPPLE